MAIKIASTTRAQHSPSKKATSRGNKFWVILSLVLPALVLCISRVVMNERSLRPFFGQQDLDHEKYYSGVPAERPPTTDHAAGFRSGGVVGVVDVKKEALVDNFASTRRNRTIVPFEKQQGVVIATKIHGDHQLHLVEQSLCPLHFAYNRRPLYDIVVFTTTPVSDESIAPIREAILPVKLTFVVDNRGLQEEIAALSKPRYDNFLKACGVTSPINLTWWSECPGRIAYNWQAEFRAWHIWRHPALKDYSTMMWLDSDAFCTMEWPVDPIQTMLENDLVILFDNWPQGSHGGSDVHARIFEAFRLELCNLGIVDGHLQSKLGNPKCGHTSPLGDIHGFFHITNLDFYRSDPVQKFAETWIGDGFLQRKYDDQAGVTIPAAISAPERSWFMRDSNINIQLNVYHNGHLDGSIFWNNHFAYFILPTIEGHCTILWYLRQRQFPMSQLHRFKKWSIQRK